MVEADCKGVKQTAVKAAKLYLARLVERCSGSLQRLPLSAA